MGFDYEKFNSPITEVLLDYEAWKATLDVQPDVEHELEKSLGHAMIEGTMQAKEALANLTVYHSNLHSPFPRDRWDVI